MTSYDAFQSKGFDAFTTPGYDARNSVCVPTTFVATGNYVWPAILNSTPTYTLTGDVAFDSLGRMWATDPADVKRPVVYDAQGNLLLTGPVQSGSLIRSCGAGSGKAVYTVRPNGLTRVTTVVCFDAVDATVEWTYVRSGADFQRIYYANGVVFVSFFDHDTLLPGTTLNIDTFELEAGGNINRAWRTVALNATTGAVIGTAAGRVRSVDPNGGLVVYHNEDDFLPIEALPIEEGTETYDPDVYINYESDLTTRRWTRSALISGSWPSGEQVQTVDTDLGGLTWLQSENKLLSINAAGTESSLDIDDTSAHSWSASYMAIDDCSAARRAFISGGFNLNPAITPRTWTVQTLNLLLPEITTAFGNFPTTLGGGGDVLRINGHWSNFS